MKLLLLCLFTVYHFCLVSTTVGNEGRHRLQEILKFVKNVNNTLKNSEYLVNTPSQNDEECCCLTALECFRANLQVHFNATEEMYVRKLIRGLRSPTTISTMSFCNSNKTTLTCKDSPQCYTHPKKSAKEFLKRLESLIQRAITQLSIM